MQGIKVRLRALRFKESVMNKMESELRRSIEAGLEQLLESGMSEAEAVEALKKIIENAVVAHRRSTFRSVQRRRDVD
jgi:hypothetical protein